MSSIISQHLVHALFFFVFSGTVKIRHLMKFITMKYGLNSDTFVVDVIYKGDIIPQDYTLIDVAYYYKWEKDAPMQYFYRIFKKNKVLLKRRKRKSKSEDKISDGKKPRPAECNAKSDKNDSTSNGKNANNNSKSGSNNKDGAKNGTDIIGCRTVAPSVTAASTPTKVMTPKVTSPKMAKVASPKKSREIEKVKKDVVKKKEMAKQKPPVLQKSAQKVTESKKVSKEQQPPSLKAETIKSEILKKVEKPNKQQKDDLQKPPVLKPVIIKTKKDDIKVDINDSSDDEDDKPPSEKKLKIDESAVIPPEPNNIKIKVSLSDVKKVEASNNVKVEVSKKEEVVKKEVKEPVVNPPPNVIKPRLIPNNPPPSRSPTSSPTGSNNAKKSNHMLSDIVNNLAKKQLGANLNTSKSDPKGTPVPPSLLGGQTTITKKEVPKVSSKDENVNKQLTNINKQLNSVNKQLNNANKPLNNVNKQLNNVNKQLNNVNKQLTSNKLEPKDPKTPKGIPSGTSVTVRNIAPAPTVTSNSSQKPHNVKPLSATSMMNFVQASKASSPTLSPSNGLVTSPSTKKTVSDLRNFRKEPTTNQNTGKPSSTNGVKSPKVPSLTSRTLTLGNSKPKTSTPPTTSSSSFSGVLSKPLPKPGEASSASNFLSQATNLSAFAALGFGLTTDEQQRALLRNMAAMGMLPPMGLPTGHPLGLHAPSMTQQLPPNRLQLKVQTSKSNTSSPLSSTVNSSSMSNSSLQMLPSLASHMAQESQWKMFNHSLSGLSTNLTNGSSSPTSTTSKFGSLNKTLNQSIRQIPNPSLLTKQNSEQEQLLQMQRAFAATQAAAAVAAASARTSLSQ